MNHYEIMDMASKHKLGAVQFEVKIAINTGKPFEVGYIYFHNSKELFCKRQSLQKDFYLCNEFAKLI